MLSRRTDGEKCRSDPTGGVMRDRSSPRGTKVPSPYHQRRRIRQEQFLCHIQPPFFQNRLNFGGHGPVPWRANALKNWLMRKSSPRIDVRKLSKRLPSVLSLLPSAGLPCPPPLNLQTLTRKGVLNKGECRLATVLRNYFRKVRPWNPCPFLERSG